MANKPKSPDEKKDPQLDMFGVLGVEKTWEEEWKGMPEFKRANMEPFQQVVVNLMTEEDAKYFGETIGQPIYPTTDSIWFPKRKTPTGIFIDKVSPEE